MLIIYRKMKSLLVVLASLALLQVESVTNPYEVLKHISKIGDLCYAKITKQYCERGIQFSCSCDETGTCNAYNVKACPIGCKYNSNSCKDPKETCAQGWVYIPTCEDLVGYKKTVCQRYFKEGTICDLNKRTGSVYFAHDKENIIEEVSKTFDYISQTENLVSRFMTGYTIETYLVQTGEIDFVCDRTFPKCINDHYDKSSCETGRVRHNERITELYKENNQIFKDILPPSICNSSGAGCNCDVSPFVYLLSAFLVVFVMFPFC
jgi:hypothetical protein